MAKSSKVEDYWRQNNIESLFKELTHMLVQRMPSDPAVAIVQSLQKKFPKSFKTSTDNNNNMGIDSKTMASSLQLQSITSPRFDINNDSSSAIDMQRRASNQSQVSGIVTIPTVGSAFTDLFKQDTSISSQPPELNIRNLIFANRLTQQGVKLRKDIQSDHDILEEEFIKPIKTKANISSTTNASSHSVPEDLHQEETHEEPSAKQLIKYKQQIHLENDRRLHQQNLAVLAKQARDKEQILQSDLPTKPGEVQQQQKIDADHTLSYVVPETSSTKSINKPIVKSKEEEEILNEENIFQPGRQRQRERYKNKLSTSYSNTPYARKQNVPNLASSMRKQDENSMPIMQFGVCKVCGNILSNDENQSIRYSQKVSTTPTARSFEPQPSTRSVESTGGIVDDWFESASDVSGSRDMLPWISDDITPRPTSTNSFQQNIFQPINDNNTVQRRPPIASLMITDDKTKLSTIPRMSESDVFVRTPEPRSLRSSPSRNIPSPVTKKHQTDTLAVTHHQFSKPTANLWPSQTFPTTERRMSGWSVSEHAPDDSDEN